MEQFIDGYKFDPTLKPGWWLFTFPMIHTISSYVIQIVDLMNRLGT